MKEIIKELMPYFWYMGGSLCFAIGTGIFIYRKLKGA